MEEENLRAVPENVLVGEAKKYIREHLSEGVTRTEIAEHVKLNESYLSRLFHRETGMSLKEYTQSERINRARQLLAETRESITVVGEQAGYETTAYFIKIFKRETGQTPGEYRKNIRKQYVLPEESPPEDGVRSIGREKRVAESKIVGLQLKRINKLLTRGVDQAVTKIGLTAAQTFVLLFLRDRQEEETCQADIQKMFDLTNPAVTKMVQRLELKGLIVTAANSDDLRRRDVKITEKGLSLLSQGDCIREKLELQTLDGFSLQEIRQLEGFLQRIHDNVEISEKMIGDD